MAGNYIQPGDTITLTAPYAVSSGGGLKVGSIFGVALAAAAISASVEAQVSGVFNLAKASGAWAQGDAIYWDDTNKNCTTNSSAGLFIGTATQAQVSGDTAGYVRLEPNSFRNKRYVNTAASAAVSNTATETKFDKSHTFAADTLKAGDVIKVRWQGIATATNSTDTLAIKLYLGGLSGTLLFTHAATDVADNNVFSGEYELVIRTDGASGTMVGVGTGKSIPAAEGTATYKDDILASTTIDTTAAQEVCLSATWSNASSGNSCRLDLLRVEVA